MDGNAVAKILRKIANAIENLDEGEIQVFLSSLTKHEESSLRDGKQPRKNKHAKIDPIALEEVLEKLSSLATRTAGGELLDQAALSRKELEALARLRNIHVTKNDDLARIKEKIIEGTIGARLSSRAIRGIGDER